MCATNRLATSCNIDGKFATDEKLVKLSGPVLPRLLLQCALHTPTHSIARFLPLPFRQQFAFTRWPANTHTRPQSSRIAGAHSKFGSTWRRVALKWTTT